MNYKEREKELEQLIYKMKEVGEKNKWSRVRTTFFVLCGIVYLVAFTWGDISGAEEIIYCLIGAPVIAIFIMHASVTVLLYILSDSTEHEKYVAKLEGELNAIRSFNKDCASERKKIEIEKQTALYEVNEAKRIFENTKQAEIKRLERKQDEFTTYKKAVEKNFADRESFIAQTESNLTAIPYMAAIIADYDTRELEIMAKSLDWGANAERQKKVVSLRTIRSELKDVVAAAKRSQYQLAYAIQMFPGLADFLETDYNELPSISLTDIGEDSHDAVRNYLSPEEYKNLSSIERNQLALDRYFRSHRKSKWQIGRDYEMFVGYRYAQKGYSVDYYGASHGLEDLGRDLIAKKGNETLIVQCKYWSAGKQIHENHINQLHGTMVCYCYENNLPQSLVRAVLTTNITVSDTARSFAKYLNVELVENLAAEDYPCIKCNINRDEYGAVTKIYHLPFDQQYDSCRIDSPGEFFAMTVAEAEAAGFRRAYRWHSGKS